MSETKTSTNPIWLIFKFLWRVMNFVRDFILTILVALLLIFIVSAIAASKSTKPVLPSKAALVIAPKGMIVEEFTGDPSSRFIAQAMGEDIPETRLRDLVDAFDRAADDDRIERILFVPHEITGMGMATANELTAAMDRFRKSDKKIITYAYGMEQKQYLLAAHTDEIYLHPEGAVIIEGLGRYRSYYREGLEDKLGVNVHLFRVGEYKSAGEPFIRDNASPEAKEADLYWMNDLWERMIADIGKQRGIDPAQIQHDADHMDEAVASVGGDLAKLAVKRKLVDGLKTQDELRAMMIELGQAADDDEHTFEQISLTQYTSPLHRSKKDRHDDEVAVVVAQGEITSGTQKPGKIGGESTSALIRKARHDDDVKALVLRVDSPGGQVFPSEQIRREVELTQKAGKPVIVSMGDLAASGGYWISMNADEIIADPSTITGSIGIFGLWMSTTDTMAKVGIHTDGVATTQLAGAFNPARPLQPIVQNTLQTVINNGYDKFITSVAKARNMSVDDVDAVARGRVWSGSQAKDRGLVDRLGLLDDAIKEAAKRADLGDGYSVQYVEPKMTPFEEFLATAVQGPGAARSMMNMGLSIGLIDQQGVHQMQQELDMLKAARENPATAFSYCFCEL